MSSAAMRCSSGCAACTRASVSPRSECSLPIATIESGLLRPIMSMLMSATTFPIGTVGCAAKKAEPSNPFSSPDTFRMMIDRLVRPLSLATDSASESSPVVPEPSSSAPLQILSSPLAVQPPTPSPAVPTWSMCAEKITYSCLSTESVPAIMATTFGAVADDTVSSLAVTVMVISDGTSITIAVGWRRIAAKSGALSNPATSESCAVIVRTPVIGIPTTIGRGLPSRCTAATRVRKSAALLLCSTMSAAGAFCASERVTC